MNQKISNQQIWNFKGGKSRKTAGSFGLDFLEKENEVGTLVFLQSYQSYHISLSLSLAPGVNMERSKATSRQQAIEGRVTSVLGDQLPELTT